MTVPSLRLLGDWPKVPAGYSGFPRVISRGYGGSPESLAIYGLLLSYAYEQDGLSPLPEDIAAGDPRMDVRMARAAFCELAFRDLIRLVPDENGRIAEILLPWPEATR